MAKTTIKELSERYGVDSKDVIAFLNEKGYDAKSVTKEVDETAAALVDSRFKSSSAPAKARTAASDGNAAASAKAGAVTPVKKKKKIIIVTGAGNGGRQAGNAYTGGSYTGGKESRGNRQQSGQNQGAQGQGRGRQQNDRNRQGGNNNAGGVYRPIKPKTVPTQMKVDYHTEDTAAASAKTAPAVETPAVQSVPATQPAPAVESKTPVTQAQSAPAVETVENKVAAAQNTAPAVEAKAPAAQETPKAAEAKAPVAQEAPKAAPAKESKAPAENAAPKAAESKAAAQEPKAPAAEPEKKPRPNIFANAGGPRPNIFANRQNAQGGQNGRRFERGQNGQGGQDRGNGQRSQGSRIRMNDNIGRNSQQSGGYRGGQGSQGGYRGGQGAQAGPGRGPQGGGFRGNQNGRPGQGGGAEGGANFADSRRRSTQFKDKRNKKDVAFVEDELREKKNKSGRFIKPVVQKEEAPEEQIKVITIPDKLTIGELAEAMHLKPADLIKKLFLAGKMMTQNSEVTYDEAENIAADYDILCEKEEKVDQIQELLREDEEDPDKLVDRAPVICVMGHVDHGKTSILDYIRDTHVTAKEAGGITQAIGAYTVETEDDRVITFLDTPGHEAFTAMRLRGAMSTDIAVLVVAADDGVMPQTVEAINHAKAAGVEIIVAVNKCDKPGAQPERVKEQLSKYELIPTDWGGTTEFVNVSAKTGQGIDDLLSTILLTADILELKANPDRLARGLVLEARLDRGRGPVANVLVQKGTLHVGDFVSAGPAFGKVRAMINDKGQNVKEAGPSMPVMVMGLSDVPSAGEVIVGHETNDEAKTYAQTYKAQHKEELVAENVMSMTTEDLFDQMREGKLKQLELIVKADVQGSVEALCASLRKLSNDEVAVKIIHSAVGNISESDVTLAEASNAAIIGFNVHPDATAKSIADHGGVSIHLYKVIYQAIDDVDAALKGMLAPVYEEKVIGHAEVRQLFKSGKIGNIAGSMVLDGVIEKGCSVRVSRRNEKGQLEQIFEGELGSLKRFKDDVKEVKAGFDCGLVFKDWDAMQVDDQIEAYKMVEVPREQVIAMKEKEKAAKEKAAKAEQ